MPSSSQNCAFVFADCHDVAVSPPAYRGPSEWQLGPPFGERWEVEIHQAEKKLVALFHIYFQLSFTAVIISLTPTLSLPPAPVFVSKQGM